MLGKVVSSVTQTHIDQLADVSRLEIPEHRGLVEVSHVGDIVELLHLWRVDLHQLTRLERLFFPPNFHIGLQEEREFSKFYESSQIYFFSFDGVNHGLIIASFAVRNPDTLLSVWNRETVNEQA